MTRIDDKMLIYAALILFVPVFGMVAVALMMMTEKKPKPSTTKRPSRPVVPYRVGSGSPVR